jgi:hypothetical protein
VKLMQAGEAIKVVLELPHQRELPCQIPDLTRVQKIC